MSVHGHRGQQPYTQLCECCYGFLGVIVLVHESNVFSGSDYVKIMKTSKNSLAQESSGEKESACFSECIVNLFRFK